jgi:hypothetical protein
MECLPSPTQEYNMKKFACPIVLSGCLLLMPLDALASDTAVISAHYGRKLDGILGYSCLSDKIVLIDYPHQTLGILDHTNDAAPMVEVYSFPAARALQLSTAEMV